MGISFVMATVVAATAASGCSWAHPGANPYRGDPTSALADFAMADDTRRQLRALMAAHHYTDVATITRDDIVGQQHYDGLREMHSGHGQTCHGAVDRSAWSDQVQERGLVYCVGDTCVIVPTICNNVSLVTRKPDDHPQSAEDDGPIDISPSAGPPPMAATAPSNEDSGQATPEFLPAPAGDGGSSVDDVAGGGGTGSAACCFIGNGGGGGGGRQPHRFRSAGHAGLAANGSNGHPAGRFIAGYVGRPRSAGVDADAGRPGRPAGACPSIAARGRMNRRVGHRVPREPAARSIATAPGRPA